MWKVLVPEDPELISFLSAENEIKEQLEIDKTVNQILSVRYVLIIEIYHGEAVRHRWPDAQGQVPTQVLLEMPERSPQIRCSILEAQ